MPESALWAIDDEGCVVCLSTWRSGWTRVVGRGSKIRHFKRLAAGSWCLWALGCDHQVYLMVHSSDIKIRVPEVIYENERWSPLGGFHSSRLHRWDPPDFSDLLGKEKRRRQDVVLPSTRWVWEDDWRIQETIHGEVTEKGGWQYAVDFSSTFGSERRLGTFVRRRRWVRYRQFIALDRWVLIPVPQDVCVSIEEPSLPLPLLPEPLSEPQVSLEEDGIHAATFVPVGAFLHEKRISNETELTEQDISQKCAPVNQNGVKQRNNGLSDLEPIVDIAVGGESLPHQEDGFLAVWVVTLNGKLHYRAHVSRRCPEGLHWQNVPVPNEEFVLSVSVGPLGNVWISTDLNQIYVRIGVTWQRPFGVEWRAVEAPTMEPAEQSSHQCSRAINQISIGVRSVWCVFTTGKFWFRRDVDCTSTDVGIDVASGGSCLLGRAWVPMVGRLRHISVGHNDQVWAIDFINHGLVHRAAVTLNSMSGKYWEPVHLVTLPGLGHGSNINSSNSSASLASCGSSIYEVWDRQRQLKKRKKRRLSTPVFVKDDATESIGTSETERENPGGDEEIFIPVAHSDDAQKVSSSRNRSLSDDHEDVVDFHGVKHTTFHLPFDDQRQQCISSVALSSSLPATYREDRTSPSQDLHPYEPNDANNDCVADMAQSASEETFPQLLPLSPSRRKLSSISNVTDTMNKTILDTENTLAPPEMALLRWVSASALLLDGALPRVWLRSNLHGRLLTSDDLHGIPCTPGVIPGLEMEKENEPTLRSTVHRPTSCIIGNGTGAQSTAWKDSILARLQERDKKEYRHSEFQKYPAAIEKESWRRDSVCQLLFGELGSERCRWIEAKVVLEQWCDGLDIKGIFSVSYKARKNELEESISVQLEEISLVSKLNPTQCNLVGTPTGGGGSTSSNTSSTGGNPSDSLPGADVVHVAMGVYALPHCSALLRIYRDWQSMNCFHQHPPHHHCVTSSHAMPAFQGNIQEKDDEAVDAEEERRVSLLQVGKAASSNNGCPPPSRQECDHPQMILRMSTEQELDDWILTLRQLGEQQRAIWLPRTPSYGLVWMLNELQEAFYSFTHLQRWELRHPDALYYNHVNGHFALVTSGAGGRLTWALTHTGTAYIFSAHYDRGYGQQTHNLTHNAVVSDTRALCTYEYQRWRLFTGFSDRKSLFNPYMWSDVLCREWRPKEAVRLLSHHWTWRGDWKVDHSALGGCDAEGWQYAKEFTSGRFVREQRWNMNIRRRKWIREYHVAGVGPWREVTPSAQLLRDISIMPCEGVLPDRTSRPRGSSIEEDDADQTDLDVWAVTVRGELLRRRGLRWPDCEGGTHWVQLETETRFVSASISPQRKLWAVCDSGSVWLRLGITPHSEGVSWTFVGPAPDACPFKQISAGGCNTVWAVDERERLWCRVKVQPLFPAGTEWQLVTYSGVAYVSCGPHNKVWATFSQSRCVAERIGITEKEPAGVGWIPALRGVAWVACVRGSFHEHASELAPVNILEPNETTA